MYGRIACGESRGVERDESHDAPSVDGIIKDIDKGITAVGDPVTGRVGRYVDGGRNKNETRVVTAGGGYVWPGC
jgi:hypothetical protein